MPKPIPHSLSTALMLIASGLAQPLIGADAALADKPIPTALAQAITREVLRPNGDPEGFPLPLAARWCGHNFTNADTLSQSGGNDVTYPFPIDRVLDDIAAGHRVMPFLGWPHANCGPNSWFEATGTFQHGFRRLAAAKLPFEFESGNIEDAMLNKAVPNGKPAENTAFIDKNWRLTTTAPVVKDAKTLAVKGLPAKGTLDVSWLLFSTSGMSRLMAAPATADADGNATLTFHEAFSEAVPAGETLLRAEPRLDFWSKAPEATWRKGGAAILSQMGNCTPDYWKKLAEIYPDPPQVQIVSNNEGARVLINVEANSWHAQQRKGEDLRDAYAKGYAANWSAYMRGMREALPWKPQTVKAIGYNAFGWTFEVGRWWGWSEFTQPLGKVDACEWLAWDGAAPDYYAYDWNYATDEHVGSPHIGAMQSYAMLTPRALAQVPNYLWQLALWDGGIKKRYRYAADGTIPGIAIGTVAVAPKDGDRSLHIRGAKPGAQLFAAGELLGIAGHSRGLPARCSATFDHLTVEADGGPDGGTAAPAVPLHGVDIGVVPVPGSFTEDGGKIRIAGSGTMVHSGAHDALFLAHRPMAGLQSISVRLAESVEDDISHAGLMLRLGTGPDTGFLSLMRNRGGRLTVFSRVQDDPSTNYWNSPGPVGGVDTPPGPLWLRWTVDRSSEPLGNRWRPWWSVDGKDWKEVLEPGSKPWLVNTTNQPLVGGLAVTTWRSGQEYRSYTVAKDVRADGKGEAEVPLAVNVYAGAIGTDTSHPAIAAGAAVERLDYLPRYEGFCTLALWLTRPRILREFGWADCEDELKRHWQVVMRVTDRVWSDPVLTRFWRKGKLVANPEFAKQTGARHPMGDLGEAWAKRWAGLDCFFQLSSPVNPPFARWPTSSMPLTATYADSTSVIKVWAIAYELGTAPKREWLLLTQSPREDRKAVQVTVPGFGEVTVDVTRSGSFHLLREGAKGATRVGTP